MPFFQRKSGLSAQISAIVVMLVIQALSSILVAVMCYFKWNSFFRIVYGKDRASTMFVVINVILAQCLLQIQQQIINILDSNAQPDHGVFDAQL